MLERRYICLTDNVNRIICYQFHNYSKIIIHRLYVPVGEYLSFFFFFSFTYALPSWSTFNRNNSLSKGVTFSIVSHFPHWHISMRQFRWKLANILVAKSSRKLSKHFNGGDCTVRFKCLNYSNRVNCVPGTQNRMYERVHSRNNRIYYTSISRTRGQSETMVVDVINILWYYQRRSGESSCRSLSDDRVHGLANVDARMPLRFVLVPYNRYLALSICICEKWDRLRIMRGKRWEPRLEAILASISLPFFFFLSRNTSRRSIFSPLR